MLNNTFWFVLSIICYGQIAIKQNKIIKSFLSAPTPAKSQIKKRGFWESKLKNRKMQTPSTCWQRLVESYYFKKDVLARKIMLILSFSASVLYIWNLQSYGICVYSQMYFGFWIIFPIFFSLLKSPEYRTS